MLDQMQSVFVTATHSMQCLVCGLGYQGSGVWFSEWLEFSCSPQRAKLPWGPPSLIHSRYGGNFRSSDHSAPLNIEMKNAWSLISISSYILKLWYLIKDRNDFTSITSFLTEDDELGICCFHCQTGLSEGHFTLSPYRYKDTIFLQYYSWLFLNQSSFKLLYIVIAMITNNKIRSYDVTCGASRNHCYQRHANKYFFFVLLCCMYCCQQRKPIESVAVKFQQYVHIVLLRRISGPSGI
jgi:hypothetical protein